MLIQVVNLLVKNSKNDESKESDVDKKDIKPFVNKIAKKD